MFKNMKIKEKIGDKYYFEREGRLFGVFTKEQINRIVQNVQSNNNPMLERKKLIDEYEEVQKKEKQPLEKDLDDKIKKEGDISHVTFYDAVIDSEIGNVHNSEFKKKIINSRIFNLYEVNSLGEIIKSSLGLKNKDASKFSSFIKKVILHKYWSLLFIAIIIWVFFKIFNVNLTDYIPKF